MSIDDQPPRAKGTFRMVPDRLWMHDRVDGTDIKVWCAPLLDRPIARPC